MNKKSLLALTTIFAGSLLFSGPAFGQLILNDFDANVINFSGFDGSGFAPTPAAGQLDSDTWRVTGMSDGAGTFGGTHTTGDFARGSSTGGVSTGGVYSFDAGLGAARVLGFQPAGSDFTPGTLTLRLQNNTGGLLESLSVSYDIWTFNDQGRSSSFNFAHSGDDSSYTAESSLDYTTPEAADGSPAWVSTPRSITLTGLSIAQGGSYYLQWQSDDVGGSGSRDEFGLSNISVSAIPEPSTYAAIGGLLALGAVLYRRRKLAVAAKG